MKISSLRKIIIVVLVGLLLYAGIVFWVIEPLWGQVIGYAQNSLLQKSALKLLQDQITTLQGFEKNYSTYQEQFKKMVNAFIDPEVPIDFIRYLEARAASNNLNITPSLSGSVGSNKNNKNDWLAIGFQLRLDGNIQGGFRFLEQIENGPRFLTMKQLTIKKEVAEALGRSPTGEALGPQNQNAIFSLSLNSYALTPAIK